MVVWGVFFSFLTKFPLFLLNNEGNWILNVFPQCNGNLKELSKLNNIPLVDMPSLQGQEQEEEQSTKTPGGGLITACW